MAFTSSSRTTPRRTGNRWRRLARRIIMRIRAATGLALIAGVLSCLVAVGLVGAATNVPVPELSVDAVLGPTPDLESTLPTGFSHPSTVVDSNGDVIAHFRPEELFIPLAPDAIPDVLADAVIAAEDEDFWNHHGFDATALSRALIRNIEEGAITEGGSTITQQVVKNLFTGGERTLDRKVDELKKAIQLERSYDKEEILAAYLNTVFFGEGAVGAEAASRTYFRKQAKDLTLAEAALLAAVIPAPTLYSPRDNPEIAEVRRQLVLDRVEAAGLASPEEVAAAREARPVVHPRLPTLTRDPFFVDYVRRWLLDVHGVDPALLYAGGLRIETTLDPDMQAAARNSVALHLPAPEHPEAAAVVVEPATGAVKVAIGGRDWGAQQVNLALGRLGGGSGRQPGSSFKPIVLALAYERGASSLDLIDAPKELHLPRGHVVHNYTRRGYGTVTLADATRRSINTAFVGLANSLDIGAVADLARRMGLTDLPEVGLGSSLAIGAYEASPLQMATAYAAFANGGQRVHPRPVQRIIGPGGEVLGDWTAATPGQRVIRRDTAALVTHTLQGVILSGTGRAADIGRPAAGKTGTANDYSDAWFVGYTPQLAAAVWVGYPEGQRSMIDVAGVARMTGGSKPARIWRDIMDHAHRDLPVAQFPTPPDRPRTNPPPPPDPAAEAQPPAPASPRTPPERRPLPPREVQADPAAEIGRNR